jgi:hypothetical protein
MRYGWIAVKVLARILLGTCLAYLALILLAAMLLHGGWQGPRR